MSLTPEVKRLYFFFGLAYFAQGISQDQSGVISQPIKYYLTKTLHLSASEVAAFTYWLILPWMIKPLYGLISDLFPIGKYRRKSYLVLSSALAALGFVLLMTVASQTIIWIAIFCTALGIAFGDVLVDALMVENGQRLGKLRLFQGIQWQWVSIAGIIAALLGGLLSDKLSGPNALRVSALIAIIPMIALLLSARTKVDEDPTPLSREALRESFLGILAAFRSPTLWKMVLILLLVNFSPSLGISYYTYETEILKFPEHFVGIEGAVGSAGAVLGAWLFNRFFAEQVPQRKLLVAALVVSGIGTLLYLLIPLFRSMPVALIVAAVAGPLGMIATLAMLSLSGEACPKRAEGFTFAALMSVYNFAAKTGERFGAGLFDRFHQDIRPLILISAVTTFIALVLVPLLPKSEKQ